MAFSSSGQYFTSTGNADADAAALTRAEFLRFQETTLPALTGLIDETEDLLNPQFQGAEIARARTDARETSALLEGVQNRNISRYGATLTPAQQLQLTRQNQLQTELSSIGAVSSLRDLRNQQGLANLGAISDIATRNYTGARDSILQAGLNEASRRSSNKIASAQRKNSLIGAGISFASIAAVVAMGGV